MKQGTEREKRKKRQAFCRKNLKWFILVGVAVAISLIVLALWIVSYITDRTTLNLLKLCLGDGISEDMTELNIPSERCNEPLIILLNLSLFKNLKKVTVGDEAMMYVNNVVIGDLPNEQFYDGKGELRVVESLLQPLQLSLLEGSEDRQLLLLRLLLVLHHQGPSFAAHSDRRAEQKGIQLRVFFLAAEGQEFEGELTE